MAKSIKFKNNTYLDSTGITHKRTLLSTILNGLQGTVLYNNATGTQGTITLSQTSANFTYLEIFFRDDHNSCNSVKVYSPNGKIALLATVQFESGFTIKAATVNISGTSITKKNKAEYVLEGKASGKNTNDYLWITRVVGYKSN